MKRYDLIVVGAGPSGLSAAIEAAKREFSMKMRSPADSFLSRYISFLVLRSTKPKFEDLSLENSC